MTVNEYIEAINSALTSEEVLTLWTKAAAETHLSLNDIIKVHRSCGKIVTDAALNVRSQGDELSVKVSLK